MKYRESTKDKKLRAWFTSDMTRGLLRAIELTSGRLRGLTPSKIDIEFPISAIAGKNGAGKSTLLAMACCAFHSKSSSYKLQRRKNAHYTFSDFFVQNSSEASPQGLIIYYTIAHNNWRKDSNRPDGMGLGIQERKKSAGGKWNDYDGRVRRTVTFLGIDRIVPHSERSQSKSYAKSFKASKPKGWEPMVQEIVGYILGKSYDDFRYLEHSKYSLPVVKCGDVTYSGFNMGAGENALFEIFSTIYSAGDGALLVLDEIELGLHAEAQRRLVERLKDTCLEMHSQIICTTHSKEIFSCLPPEARFFIESVGGKTKVTKGISPEFAFGKLNANNSAELEIFVEDEVAKSILQATLPSAIRSRIFITVVGSASALSRQLAASYIRKEKTSVLAIFDGDQKSKESENRGHAEKMAEKPAADFVSWFNERITYLPGETWPEAWLIQRASDVLMPLSAILGTESDALNDILEYGQQAGKHNEFFEISHHLGLDPKLCLQQFSTVICQSLPGELNSIVDRIKKILE
jgi:predicted ATPase